MGHSKNSSEIKWTDLNGVTCKYTSTNTTQCINNDPSSFNRISDILYNSDYHLRFKENYFNNNDISDKLKSDFKRVSLLKNNLPENPKFLFLVLSSDNENNLSLNPYTFNLSSHWHIHNNCIQNTKNKLYLNVRNKNLVLSKTMSKWDFSGQILMHSKTRLYLSFDIGYHLYLTSDTNEAMIFNLDDELIYYKKPEFRIKVETNVAKYSKIKIENILQFSSSPAVINVGIILAAGRSERFNSQEKKQLFILNSKPVLCYSIDAIKDKVDHIIIVSNSGIKPAIQSLVANYANAQQIEIIINDENDRFVSISKAIDFIYKKFKYPNKLIIHDAARCFINEDHVSKMLENKDTFYSQYYLKLINGLYKINDKDYNIVDREQYIELMTPLCIDFNLCYTFYSLFMKKNRRITVEFLYLLEIFKIKPFLIEGKYSFLKKLTTADDVL